VDLVLGIGGELVPCWVRAGGKLLDLRGDGGVLIQFFGWFAE